MTTTPAVRVVVNGVPVDVAPGTRLVDLLAARGIDPVRVAVERNRAVVPRGALAEVVLADGDGLEIVHFVGGG